MAADELENHTMSIANILFDLDGTLTDPREGIVRCIRYALEKMGAALPLGDDLDWCIGPPLRNTFARLLDTGDPARIERAVSLYRRRFSGRGMYENAVYPGVAQSLHRIKAAGVRIFLATAKPTAFAGPILVHFRLGEFFDGVYGSELSGRFSDKGELIAHILDTEKLHPAETLMVGDRADDVLGGRANGVRTAAVSYGYGNREEIAAAKPDYRFEVIDALADWVERQSIVSSQSGCGRVSRNGAGR